jgi:very-short-patch-repair endonuclease
VTLAELTRAARALPGVRAAARARRVLELADPESGSVLESVLRVRMHLAGIAGFSTQLVIRDDAGRHVLRVDFCFAEARLVVEVDGEKWHQDPARDRSRDNALAALGWRVLRYTWAEVVHQPERVLAEIRQALGATADHHPARAEVPLAA